MRALLLLSIFAFASASSARDAVAPSDIEALLDLMQRSAVPPPGPSLVCGQDSEPLPESVAMKTKRFLAGRKCAALFSETPPTWVSANANARILKNPGNWHPVCSLFFLEAPLSKTPPQGEDEKITAAEKELAKRDRCGEAEGDRYAEGYRAPTQKGAGVRRMTPSETGALAAHFVSVRESAASRCCGSDEACLGAMRAVELSQCLPKEDPNVPDPCLTGAYFDADSSQLQEWVAWLSTPDLTEKQINDRFKRFPILSGKIVLSPFAYEQPHDVNLFNGDFPLTHELGHACSFIRRSIAIRAGKPGAIGTFITHDSCDIDFDARTAYGALYGKMGFSPETRDCLVDQAKGARNARFTEKDCPGACPRSFLEESFGDAFEILSAGPDRFFPDVYPYACNGMRDSLHALTMDDFRCLLRTPALRKRFEKDSGCQP